MKKTAPSEPGGIFFSTAEKVKKKKKKKKIRTNVGVEPTTMRLKVRCSTN